MADVTMAPCADMFEMGAKVEVIKKKTMYAQNAQELYEFKYPPRCYSCRGPENFRIIKRCRQQKCCLHLDDMAVSGVGTQRMKAGNVQN